jgi:long-chain acyl-CoA synthetase
VISNKLPRQEIIMAISTGIISKSGRRSFDDIEQRVLLIAGGLKALGVGEGDCVCILMRNDIAFIEVSYAIMLLGAYAVPINWHFKPEEVDYILKDTATRVLIGHADLLGALCDIIAEDMAMLSVPTPPEIESAYRIDPSRRDPPHGADDLELWMSRQRPYDGPKRSQPQSMIYTSGTTGQPKGVRRNAPTAAQVTATETMRARVYGLKPGVRALLPGPLYHSAPNAFALRAGRLGGALVLMPRFDAEELLRLVQDEAIDTIMMVPTMFVRLLKLPAAVREKYDVSWLRHVVHAAAPCPRDIKQAMMQWWGPVIHEYYGSTESGAVTYAAPEDAIRKPGTVGRILDGAELRILDDDGNILPRGVVGEIYSRSSDSPDFSYQNKPEKRSEIERDGFITSGDVGFLDEDGYLFISDRKRDMVISGGVNIYPAEIEAALHGLPGVHDCAVFGIPDEEFGEALMAVIEPQAGVTIDPDMIRAQLRSVLAGYKIPRHIELQAGLPREDSGKIFKRRLRDPYWEKSNRRI